jgi:hypothetical protein
MPERRPELSGSAVVLIGSFNPQIFHPLWFAKQNLLPQTEAENAEVKVMIPDITVFESERFVVQVTHDRFVAGTRPNADPAPLKDLVAGTFFVLEHTPVTGMGLNFQMHFGMGDEKTWHEVGDRLAPKAPWSPLVQGRPGLLSMTIQGQMDEPKGALFTVKVETSTQVKFGIYFETNEHYPAPDENQLEALMARLGNRWPEAQIYATKVATDILDWGTQDKSEQSRNSS